MRCWSMLVSDVFRQACMCAHVLCFLHGRSRTAPTGLATFLADTRIMQQPFFFTPLQVAGAAACRAEAVMGSADVLPQT